MHVEKWKTSWVTYVTLVPRGNETLRRDAMGNAISVVQLWIICVFSQNWWPDVRCGDVMTSMLKSTWCAAGASFQEWSIALVGMPEVWPCDAASRSLGGTRVTYVTRDVPLREHRAASRRYGERDVHAAILANPCLVCGMHSYGKGIDKPGVAHRARS